MACVDGELSRAWTCERASERAWELLAFFHILLSHDFF